MGFVEVADRVWVARHEWFDVNVTVLGGSRGVLVVDTLASSSAGTRLAQDVRRFGPLVGVVNTHEHFDHVFGNAAFAPPIFAHAEAAARTVAAGERIKAAYEASDDPHRDEVLATPIVPADSTFDAVRTVDLGDRVVDLRFLGRGHTGADIVVAVADVVVAGDLVEESASPSFGADSFPLEWPATLSALLGMLVPDAVVVPGHGAVVGSSFVAEQEGAVRAVADTIKGLFGAGVAVDHAVAAGAWPYPGDHLADAVRRGYAALAEEGPHG